VSPITSIYLIHTTTVQRSAARRWLNIPRAPSPSANGCLQGLCRQAPPASFSACLVSKTRPIVPILLSKASVADDRVSPYPTLLRAGTLAPGWYDSRAVLLELLYVSTAATASPAKNLNRNIGMLCLCSGRWCRLAKVLQLRTIVTSREPHEMAESSPSRQTARPMAGPVNLYCESQES